jgi:beta-galactosidase
MPVFASETASHVSSRGEYADDRPRGYVSEYSGYPEWSWKPVAERAFVAGSFVWTGFDYRGEPSPYDWPCISSHFGILDTCGFPKDAYWYYKAWWGSEPLVHVFPHWTWPGREGQDIDVWCYSNCERVELFVNGQSAGARDMPRWGHVAWKVKYAPGALEVHGITGGKVVTTDKVETTGAPASIRISPDRAEIMADNEDLSVVRVAILDDAGRLCPNADNEVVFSVKGPARVVGVGNGDPSSHEPDNASQRRAYHGYCAVFVQSTSKAGGFRLTASSAGLKTASALLRSRKP